MTEKKLINTSSVILATGGANGITARCVLELAEHASCKYILLGLSSIEEPLPEWAKNGANETETKKMIMQDLLAKGEKPTPMQIQHIYKELNYQKEIEENLQALRDLGSQAEYICVNVTDADAMKEKLSGPIKRFGAVTGVLHGAGSLADKLIENKQEKDYDRVVSPKVDGLENILQCVDIKQLDFIVFFSSVVSVYGNVGQADYAVANEILNKSAYRIKQENPSCRALSINWGPWDTGMVTPELKKAFAANNITLIPADAGPAVLADELISPEKNDVQVVVGSPIPRQLGEPEVELRQHQIVRKLKLEANPFLYDHMIGENPVLPATCAAAWVANACEGLYPGYTFFNFENYKVLKGIVFNNKQPEEYTLDLKEISKTRSGEIVFETRVSSQNKNGRPLYHYSLIVRLLKQIPPMPVFDLPPELSVSKEKIVSGQTLYENGTLFHGPSFQGVNQVFHVSPERLVMKLMHPRVAETTQGQFTVQTSNPYINDAIIQSVLVWSQDVHKAPCLPAGLQKLEQYRPIPFDTACYATMDILSQTSHAVVADVRVQDDKGQIYLQIGGMQGTISEQLNRVIGVKTR